MRFNPAHIITVTTTNNVNPKIQYATRKGVVVALASYKRFAFYLANPGCTVQQYYNWCAAPAQRDIAAKGVAGLDLAWDTEHGYINVAEAKAAPLPAWAPSVALALAPPPVPASATAQVAVLPVQPKQRKAS